MASFVDADTLLAVDVGSVNTRASLFDVVEGRYRLVATGRVPSTADAPLFDVSEGVRQAMDRVQAVTGRRLVDESEALIMPVTSDGLGVDVFVATTSAGPKVRTVLVGLMPGVSMESARRLAESTYLEVIESIDLLDRRKDEEHIDRIIAARPDLILVAGGTDGGATASVLRMVELVRLAVSLISEDLRPRVVYAGNQHLAATVAERFGERSPLAIAPNIRPSLLQEDLAPTRLRLAEVIAEVRGERVGGYEELRQWSGGYLMQTADAFGRVVRYLSEVYDPAKGVLGVDLGASHTTVAAAFAGDLYMNVWSDLGLGASLPGLLRHVDVEEVQRWLPIEASPSVIRDYIYNKGLSPGTVPVEGDELHLEYALARLSIQAALTRAQRGWPAEWGGGSWLLPPMEPIVASGGALARAPKPGYAALALLDGLQPTGISTLILDPYNLAPALGAAAGPLPMVTVQVLNSGSFVSLGTVVAPVGRAKVGRPALRLRLEREGGGEDMEGVVRVGQLVVLPLRQGEYANLTLRPERGFDVGFGGPGRAGALRVSGGVVGLIIDARGRPLTLPRELDRCRELNRKWLHDIGAVT